MTHSIDAEVALASILAAESKPFVVLQWYYNDRDERSIFPELEGVFGPFVGRTAAEQWVTTASTWGGWGPLEYQVKELYAPV